MTAEMRSSLARNGVYLICVSLFLASEAQAEEELLNLLLDAKPVLDVRYRYEHVDQDGFSKNANANTVRTRIGFETGRFYGIGGGFDFEWIEAIGDEDFNSTTNGRTRFPTVADPDDDQVNQAYIVADGLVPHTALKFGRQRIIWDNARFIGNVGFRQNEQTFDAFRGSVSAIPDLELEYAYLDEVRRIFGTKSPVGSFDMNGHGIRAYYSGFEAFTLTPFALLLDFEASLDGIDSQTYGFLLEGSQSIDDDWSLLYSGSLAYQTDYKDNPADFEHWYYRIESGLSFRGAALRLGFEVLEGDGATAFQTPLATLHKFNGLTDQFLTTPADGLQDLYISASVPIDLGSSLPKLNLKGGYHQYWADDGNAHYGSEWDIGLFTKVPVEFGAVNLSAQYASYDADNFSADEDILWLTVQFQLDPNAFRN